MRVIGYAYNAAVHCVACTKAREFDLDPDGEQGSDEHGVPYAAIDGKRNPIHPVFSTDETPPYGEYCDDCHDEVAEPWLPDGYEVFYIDEIDAAENARLNGNGTNDFVDCVIADTPGWYWWSCQPGCLPDGDPCGPFDTEDEALRDCVSDLAW